MKIKKWEMFKETLKNQEIKENTKNSEITDNDDELIIDNSKNIKTEEEFFDFFNIDDELAEEVQKEIQED